jgi:hypothetical protein
MASFGSFALLVALVLAGYNLLAGALVLRLCAEGFELIAWIAPFAVFAAGLVGTILLVRRWTGVPLGQEAASEANVPRKGGHHI